MEYHAFRSYYLGDVIQKMNELSTLGWTVHTVLDEGSFTLMERGRAKEE